MAADRVVGKQAAVPRVFVYLTKGGILGHVVDGELDMEVVDFQNLAEGDVAPEMTSEMIEMLRREAPDLLIDLDKYRARLGCQNCGKDYWDEAALLEIKHLLQRVSPGEPMPAGECPQCGALVGVIERKSWLEPHEVVADTCKAGHVIASSNTERIASIMMQDVVGDYDEPGNVPEWTWIEAHASYVHRQNATSGIWEFMLNLSIDYPDLPGKLASVIAEAKVKGVAYLLFHQGT